MNSIKPIISELERVYEALAKEFKLKAPKPLITIQSRGRSKDTLGWHWAKKWQYNKKELSEINICAESLNKTPISTLIHEMVHYSNAHENIKDCNSHQYHNKAFKTKAEFYGLNVEKNGRHGWSYTTLSNKLKPILEKLNINYDLFKIYRKTHISFIQPTKMKKWRCDCTTIRCAVELNATCNKCNQNFKEQDG